MAAKGILQNIFRLRYINFTIIKDSLGGNSRTWVCAAVSPSSDCIEETLSTLRWADRARKVQCHAVVNEDPTAKERLFILHIL